MAFEDYRNEQVLQRSGEIIANVKELLVELLASRVDYVAYTQLVEISELITRLDNLELKAEIERLLLALELPEVDEYEQSMTDADGRLGRAMLYLPLAAALKGFSGGSGVSISSTGDVGAGSILLNEVNARISTLTTLGYQYAEYLISQGGGKGLKRNYEICILGSLIELAPYYLPENGDRISEIASKYLFMGQPYSFKDPGMSELASSYIGAMSGAEFDHFFQTSIDEANKGQDQTNTLVSTVYMVSARGSIDQMLSIVDRYSGLFDRTSGNSLSQISRIFWDWIQKSELSADNVADIVRIMRKESWLRTTKVTLLAKLVTKDELYNKLSDGDREYITDSLAGFIKSERSSSLHQAINEERLALDALCILKGSDDAEFNELVAEIIDEAQEFIELVESDLGNEAGRDVKVDRAIQRKYLLGFTAALAKADVNFVARLVYAVLSSSNHSFYLGGVLDSDMVRDLLYRVTELFQTEDGSSLIEAFEEFLHYQKFTDGEVLATNKSNPYMQNRKGFSELIVVYFGYIRATSEQPYRSMVEEINSFMTRIATKAEGSELSHVRYLREMLDTLLHIAANDESLSDDKFGEIFDYTLSVINRFGSKYSEGYLQTASADGMEVDSPENEDSPPIVSGDKLHVMRLLLEALRVVAGHDEKVELVKAIKSVLKNDNLSRMFPVDDTFKGVDSNN